MKKKMKFLFVLEMIKRRDLQQFSFSLNQTPRNYKPCITLPFEKNLDDVVKSKISTINRSSIPISWKRCAIDISGEDGEIRKNYTFNG